MSWLVCLGLVAAATLLYRLGKPDSPEVKFLRGQIFAEKLIAGQLDSEVAGRLNLDIAQVGMRQRMEYVESLVEESRHFGTFDEFDKGCLARLATK